MIPIPAIAAFYSLAGHGLSENAEKREWTGELVKRVVKRRAPCLDSMLSEGGKPPHIATGRLEKSNPLPPGRYWIDVFVSGREAWLYWSMYAFAHLHIEKTEHYEGDVSLGYEDRDWILFTTNAPLTWDIELAKKIGWPSTAPTSIQTSTDTVDKPNPEDILPSFDKPEIKLAVAGVGIIVAAVLIGYSVRSFK